LRANDHSPGRGRDHSGGPARFEGDKALDGHQEEFVCHGINTRDSGMGYQCTRQEYIVRTTVCREHTLGTSFKSRALCSNTGGLMNNRRSCPGLAYSDCVFDGRRVVGDDSEATGHQSQH
jgi:hypothetical protein